MIMGEPNEDLQILFQIKTIEQRPKILSFNT